MSTTAIVFLSAALTCGSICKHSGIVPGCDIANEVAGGVLVDFLLGGEGIKGAIKDVFLLPGAVCSQNVVTVLVRVQENHQL